MFFGGSSANGLVFKDDSFLQEISKQITTMNILREYIHYLPKNTKKLTESEKSEVIIELP